MHFDTLKEMPAFDMVKAQSALACTKTLTSRQPHPRHLHKPQSHLCYFEKKKLYLPSHVQRKSISVTIVQSHLAIHF